ncbi:MAG: hypothetical protein IKD45_01525 [Clostridia bacterium]|nr:hypothetical protein [Clostridia bacterium]
MKRIIAVILMLACFACLTACKNNETPDNGNGGNTATVETFTTAMANTKPTGAIITATVSTSLGDLTSRFNIVYAEDGSAVITYSYEKFNGIDEGAADEVKTTYEGTVTRAADGTYSSDDASVPDLSAVNAGVALDLSKLDASKVTINEKGDVLTATVAAADTDDVFGTAFSMDMTLKISIADGQVELVNIDYEGGSIVCQYN